MYLQAGKDHPAEEAEVWQEIPQRPCTTLETAALVERGSEEQPCEWCLMLVLM